MSIYKYIDIPKIVEPELYKTTVNHLLDNLKREKNLRSVYQLGNTNHPGISDIDVIAIFHENSKAVLNPTEDLTEQERYLVTHNLAGTTESKLKSLLPFTFLDNLRCLYGENLETSFSQDQKERDLIHGQIGLEFLYKNYIELSVQRKYGVIRLRSTLQKIKGIRYDLKFLKIENERINKYVSDLLERLDSWFTTEFKPIEFSKWLDDYYSVLEGTIKQLSQIGVVPWMPSETRLNYGRNIELIKDESFDIKYNGVFLPSTIISSSRKIYNFHQRLNEFKIGIDYSTLDDLNIHAKRMEVFQDCKSYNRKYLPYYGNLSSSLAYHLI